MSATGSPLTQIVRRCCPARQILRGGTKLAKLCQTGTHPADLEGRAMRYLLQPIERLERNFQHLI